MMIPAPEPESRDLRLLTAGGADGSRRIPLADGRLPGEGREPSGGASAAARRLRTAAPVQLELVSGRQGPGPEVVWGSLPERCREAVLVLLARLIDAGAVEEDAA
jgi:hypothetical protein